MEEEFPLCPSCETSLDPNIDQKYTTCPKCGHKVNLDSQWAYLRCVDAFSEGQDIFMTQPPRKRRMFAIDAVEQSAVDLYIKAYSALQVAFQAKLSESQRQLGIEMMANMSQLFLHKNMIRHWKPTTGSCS
jgi:DNA-directed RNA polymerase subunit RPC12/RpoP